MSKIKYRIIVEKGDHRAESFMESNWPLTGKEPIVAQRFEAANKILEDSIDEAPYWDAFSSVVKEKVKNES